MWLIGLLCFWTTSVASQNSFVYDLAKPVSTFKLDDELREISGLTYSKGRLLAVQDEKGKVFELNPQTGEIIGEKKFWSKGDFEGIEVAGDYIFALKSNGNLYKCPIDSISEEATTKYDLGFNSGWNFEAIGFKRETGELIIAAKRAPRTSRKEIFSIPVADPYAIGEPEMIMQQAELWDNLKNSKKRWAEKVAHSLGTINYSFNPSGIAIHPGNGEIYVLSSPVPQLAIYSSNWKLRKVIALDSRTFRQPESICFDDYMNLYIGNEGGSGKASILKFVPQ